MRSQTVWVPHARTMKAFALRKTCPLRRREKKDVLMKFTEQVRRHRRALQGDQHAFRLFCVLMGWRRDAWSGGALEKDLG